MCSSDLHNIIALGTVLMCTTSTSMQIITAADVATGSTAHVALRSAGRSNLGCTDSLDCSLLGRCVAGVCMCTPGWTGAHLGVLTLVVYSASYRYIHIMMHATEQMNSMAVNPLLRVFTPLRGRTHTHVHRLSAGACARACAHTRAQTCTRRHATTQQSTQAGRHHAGRLCHAGTKS